MSSVSWPVPILYLNLELPDPLPPKISTLCCFPTSRLGRSWALPP